MVEAYALSQMLSVVENVELEQRLRKLKALLAESDIDDMKAVVEQYLTRRWNIAPESIASAEVPVYTLLLPTGDAWNGKPRRPAVAGDLPAHHLRLDLPRRRRWIVGRDYKTFSKNVTHDNDLDFQGKIEMAVLQHHYKTDRARFEYINVRQTPPDVVKDKSGGKWREDECYSTDDFYPSAYELIRHLARNAERRARPAVLPGLRRSVCVVSHRSQGHVAAHLRFVLRQRPVQRRGDVRDALGRYHRAVR